MGTSSELDLLVSITGGAAEVADTFIECLAGREQERERERIGMGFSDTKPRAFLLKWWWLLVDKETLCLGEIVEYEAVAVVVAAAAIWNGVIGLKGGLVWWLVGGESMKPLLGI